MQNNTQTLATDRNNKTWIITADGYMIDTITGIKTELDAKLFESKSVSTTIKGNWTELEDISIIDNEYIEYVTEGTAIFQFDGKEYAKDFLILIDISTNEPILIKYDDQNASMNIGVNNTFATYLNTLDATLVDELMLRLGYNNIGEHTYMSDKHIMILGEYCTVKEIKEQREVNIKSKLSNLGAKMKARADKELSNKVGV